MATRNIVRRSLLGVLAIFLGLALGALPFLIMAGFAIYMFPSIFTMVVGG
jgi:hypothetical protein